MMPRDNAFEQQHIIQRPWTSRGYLPHFDPGEIPQMVTFRLADSLPQCNVEQYRDELMRESEQGMTVDADENWVRFDGYLDKGYGECWFRHVEIAEIVQSSLLWFDNQKYQLHAWVIMPNHVHALLSPIGSARLAEIVHSWKSFTAHKANKLLNRDGSFWQREYFDRYMRTEEHFATAITYIELNPVKAGLCNEPDEWSFSSCKFRST